MGDVRALALSAACMVARRSDQKGSRRSPNRRNQARLDSKPSPTTIRIPATTTCITITYAAAHNSQLATHNCRLAGLYYTFAKKETTFDRFRMLSVIRQLQDMEILFSFITTRSSVYIIEGDVSNLWIRKSSSCGGAPDRWRRSRCVLRGWRQSRGSRLAWG